MRLRPCSGLVCYGVRGFFDPPPGPVIPGGTFPLQGGAPLACIPIEVGPVDIPLCSGHADWWNIKHGGHAIMPMASFVNDERDYELVPLGED